MLYDHRDEMSALTRLVVLRSPFLRDLTEMETSNLAQRSRKLFTLSALHAATKALLDGIEESNFERRVDLASKYWELVIGQFPEWDQVFNREITAGEVRRDFIHTHGIVLHALGKVGNSLLSQGKGVRSWSPALKKLRDVDWHRASSTWEEPRRHWRPCVEERGQRPAHHCGDARSYGIAAAA